MVGSSIEDRRCEYCSVGEALTSALDHDTSHDPDVREDVWLLGAVIGPGKKEGNALSPRHEHQTPGGGYVPFLT